MDGGEFLLWLGGIGKLSEAQRERALAWLSEGGGVDEAAASSERADAGRGRDRLDGLAYEGDGRRGGEAGMGRGGDASREALEAARDPDATCRTGPGLTQVDDVSRVDGASALMQPIDAA